MWRGCTQGTRVAMDSPQRCAWSRLFFLLVPAILTWIWIPGTTTAGAATSVYDARRGAGPLAACVLRQCVTRRGELVTRLLAGAFDSEAAEDEAIADFSRRVPHPSPTDLIYHWESAFDHQPSAEEVVDHALAYRSIEL